MSDSNEAPRAGVATAKLLLELIKGRKLTIRDAMDEFGLNYQQARRYLHAVEHVTAVRVERNENAEKVYQLAPRSIGVHPDLYVEDTGQLTLFGDAESEEGEEG